jgi:predicted signal transduction protein with EAL and GGDEF domain
VRSLGDEFIAVIDNISGPQDAADTSTRLLAAMAAPFQIDEHELLLSASVGISLHPEHGTELVTLQERADKAMYVAKSHGRNQFALFSTEVARREEVLQEIGRDLYRALPHGQFHLCYQPLVERSAEVVGFEALLRWTHPVHGEISPAEFIPIAERSGLIVGIGEWVLREACRNCTAWQREGHPRWAWRSMSPACNSSGPIFQTWWLAFSAIAGWNRAC